jgi:hypothetical protein
MVLCPTFFEPPSGLRHQQIPFDNYPHVARFYQQTLQFDPVNKSALVNYGLLLATRGVKEVRAGHRKHFYLNREDPLETAQELLRRAIRADAGRGRVSNSGYLLQEVLLEQGALRPIATAASPPRGTVPSRRTAAGRARRDDDPQ